MNEKPNYSSDAEASVLGALIIDNTKISKVKDKLKANDFFERRHQLIYQAMVAIHGRGEPIDILTLCDSLTRTGYLDQAGGAAYLTELTNYVPSAAHVMSYAKLVAEYSAKRSIVKAAREIVKSGENESLEDALLKVKEKIAEVNRLNTGNNKFELASMADYIEAAKERFENWGKMYGLSTGFPSIDKLTLGLPGGELIIIAGETSRGKQSRCSEVIPTPGGDRIFGTLKIGDYIFGSDGKPTKITGVFPQGVMPIYRVHFSDGSYLDTGKEHLWTLRRHNRPDRVLSSNDLLNKLPGHGYYVPLAKALEYSDDSEPMPAYLLGMYIADGSWQNSHMRITKKAGPVSDYIKSLDPTLVRYDHPSSCGYWHSHKDSAASLYLKSSGLSDVQSHDKFIPNEWFSKSVEVRKRLLHGLMDGDGTFFRIALYSTTSEQLADDVVRLVTSLGGIARKSVVRHYKGNYFSVRISALGFNPFLIKKYKDVWSVGKNSRKHRFVKSVEILSEPAEAMCISVDAPDQLYVADTRFNIVTHNTLLSMNIANNVAKWGGRVLFVTLEMTHAELTSRYMFLNGGADTDQFITVAANTVFQHNDELDWKDIDGLIANAKEQLDVDLVVVDHLHYFTRELQNVSEDLGRITKEFKKNAIRHNIPVILISHVRKIGKGEDLDENALRGSSLIGQDADIVLFVNRDPETNAMGVMITKNRNRGKLSDRTKDWNMLTEKEINTVILEFNNTKLQDPYVEPPLPPAVQQVFPDAKIMGQK